MSYKTVVVHVDSSVHAAARIGVATAVANAEGAHLIGAAMTGISRFVCPEDRDALARTAVGGYINVLYEQADKALGQFETMARAAGVATYEKRLVNDDPAGALVQLAHFCDLIVMSQNDPGQPVPCAATDVPELVILSCARPVLLVPYSGKCDRLDGKILVAWDGSIEASRALAAAIALLRRAEDVVIALFQLPRSDKPEEPAPDLVAWLARHQVKARVLIQDTDIHAGDALLELAANTQSDLIVMGGYGHARFREFLLGGVTATVLRSMKVPVLMAH
jgi:nucleotide-binding universal stress UspA family protein